MSGLYSLCNVPTKKESEYSPFARKALGLVHWLRVATYTPCLAPKEKKWNQYATCGQNAGDLVPKHTSL